ncbi:MAG: ribosome biogenesis GTP-binding protein YihA/YsxC [Clostridiales bacterium]|nr:ribosome biogenesis GTP-binding protein YihA/YsxC [Clostridiales bacterium]
MIIKTAEFVRSAKLKKDYHNQELPEIAIVGKSNVGKSSLINALTNNSKLARVSKQPGKTRLVNFFLLNQQFYLVDLPGYGFARVSKAEKETWDEMMRTYFENSKQLRAVILLLDIRHKPTKEDIAMLHYIEYYAIPYVVCLTKADKIAKSKRKNEAVHKRKEIPSSFAYDIIPISSEEGYGKQELLDYLERYLPELSAEEAE